MTHKHPTLKSLLKLALPLALIAAVVLIAACAPPGQVRTRVTIGVGHFYDHLAVYGDWTWIDAYGWVWSPWDVGPAWRPYTRGHWVHTFDGWTWVSDWNWGWAPFHYGRWLLDDVHGWVWIPGTEWAPAWVAWRYGAGTVGWAPLPPHARWVPSGGMNWDGVGLSVHAWTFVPDRDFLRMRLETHITFGDHDHGLLDRTRIVSRYETGPHGVIVHGVPLADMQRIHGAVPTYHLDELGKPPQADRRLDRDAVRVYRPEVRKAPDGAKPPPAKGPKKGKSGRGHG